MSEKESLIRILPLEDPEFLKRLNTTYGTKAHFGLLYVEKREIKSTCLYNLQKPHGQILNISSYDPEIFRALAEACMNIMKEQGMEDVRFGSGVSEELLSELNLPEEKGARTYSLI